MIKSKEDIIKIIKKKLFEINIKDLNGDDLVHLTRERKSLGSLKNSQSHNNIRNCITSRTIDRCIHTLVQANVMNFFKSMDVTFNNKLGIKEFEKGILRLCLEVSHLNESEINKIKNYTNELFKQIDSNSDCFIEFSEFVYFIRPPMCPRRLMLINESFNKLDYDGNNLILFNDLKYWFHDSIKSIIIKKTNDSLTEFDLNKKVNDILRKWLYSFELNRNEKLGVVTREIFISYYTVISCTIMNDAYFDLFMRKTFNL
jgi:hypothetical protein